MGCPRRLQVRPALPCQKCAFHDPHYVGSGSGSVDAFGDMPRHPGGGRGHPDDYDDFGGDPAYLRDQMRERRHPRDIDDPRGSKRTRADYE